MDGDAMNNIDAGVTELTSVVARMQGMLISHEAAAATVEKLAQVARDMVESAVGAGASLMDSDGRRVSTATTDRVAAMADTLQYQLGQGPCISAWASSSVQRLDDTAVDSRWPAWSTAARELGIRSVLSAPLVFKGDVIGALKVYSTTTAAFSADDEHRLVLLSAAAATLLGMARGPDAPQRLSADLTAALADRQAIDTATGLLMERHGLGQDAARYRLMDASRAGGHTLAHLARQVLSGTSEPTL
jgi:transcriptional regulator with GAF, ATPase, and Fis domain